MVRILNISEGSTIAMHAAILLSKGPGKPITTNDAAESLKVSAAHLSKVFQRLAKAGIVHAVRGPKGGYLLGRPLSQIRLLDVLEVAEDVGVIELDRRHDRRARAVVEELGALVEEGGVVLVALDDEVRARAGAIRLVEVERRAGRAALQRLVADAPGSLEPTSEVDSSWSLRM